MNKLTTTVEPEMKKFDLLALHEGDNKVSMTSLDISELVGSRHSDVKRSIERLVERNIIQNPPIAFLERINNLGLTVKDEVYSFEGVHGKRDSIVVVAQLRPELTAQIVDRWRELESGKALPYSQQQLSINPEFLSLAQAVAESTASGIMKTILENTGIQAVVHVNAAVSALPTTTLVEPVLHHADQPTQDNEPEYVPVHKVSWASGLSDPTCRRLVTFYDLPNCQLDGVRGLCVHREFFMAAVKVLIKESAPPAKGRKRWYHPEFGRFELRKDLKEIFGEGSHDE